MNQVDREQLAGATERYQSDSAPSDSERPLGTILSELWVNLEKLLRQELDLASAKLDTKIATVKADLATAAIGGGLMFGGFMALLAATILLLAQVVSPWVAALLVGVVAAGSGYALLRRKTPDDEDQDQVTQPRMKNLTRLAEEAQSTGRR